MNERIKEFAFEARLITVAGITRYASDYEFEKRFAELIIRECLDQCYNRGMNDELYAGQLKAAAYIEQHFGVEE